MTAKSEELLFIWTDPSSRRRNVVGCLERWSDHYTFRYARHLRTDFERKSWIFPSFPDPTRVYESTELFPAFERRLPASYRPDFGRYVVKFGLKPPVTSWELLKATGGRLATDTFEFAIPLQKKGSRVKVDFYVAGWQYHGARVDRHEYSEGVRLEVEPEPNNPFDQHAHRIVTKQGHVLGYVPHFYAETLSRLGVSAHAVVRAYNHDAGPQGALYVHLVGTLPPSVDVRADDFRYC